MAKIKVDLKELDSQWDYIVNLNLDAVANAKVLLNKPEFSVAKKILTLSAVGSAVIASTATGLDVCTKLAMIAEGFNYLPDNSVPMMLQDISKSGTLKHIALASIASSAVTGVISTSRSLINVIDKYITKHNPQIESARVKALAEAYGEIYDLFDSTKPVDGKHLIDSTYDQIRPIAEALGQTTQRQKDTVFYSFMSERFNHPMSVDDPDTPAVIDHFKIR